ncbi:heavy metal translocating P-type ATPase [Arthrobacter sp. I2-34]|uniref:Heavy metal translocating P-type ATPase n=1 Tax=Arthrobacter hankyongi TaxID=2904801 RepID=A0ABS9L683_9MICC|nr:heavy metal translocating P-type ATPase [Arthrobacter hankyongi]MCG2622178.1 heavy metal translocating P-type ATPase [Arthrobacter hankyongi]
MTLGFINRYPLVVATLLCGVAVASFLLVGQDSAAQWLASGFSLFVAARLAVGMVRALARGRWGIDLLAVTAVVSTVLVGEYIASLIIVLMLSGGQALEDFAQGRAKRELTALLERAPQVAHRERDGGPPEEISVEQVVPGDLLLLRPAEVVPVDGVLVSDFGSFDESALTGESLPVERTAGDPVLSGSVNGEAAVRMQATASVGDSQYSRIVALVREASASRAPVVRLADRYAVPFTAFAFLLAGAAWLASGDPGRFAEVLVVATPCPLLIAAPVAFVGGMGRAARSGIIIKNGGTLEKLSRVRTVAFDKTGTLTGGRPVLLEIRAMDGPAGQLPADELLRLAASAEQYSSHVLAASVMEAAEARGLVLVPARDATEHATHGVIADFGGRAVVIGKRRFVAEEARGTVKTPLASGQMAVYIGVDGAYAGALVLSDAVRPNAASTLEQLRRLGLDEMIMLTGDARETAEHIAREVGLDRIQAECLPADKVETVRALPRRPVMMVGDGVNDAPVLAAADVGVAMGAKGSTAASESADVVIMLDDLSKVAQAVEIGQRSIKVALQSIWIGILLSVGLMVAAAFGHIPAVAGALSQELVDLATILNALRALVPARAAGGIRSQPGRIRDYSRAGE